MSNPIAASYWLASAHVGKAPPVAPDPRSTTASYWSSAERSGDTTATTTNQTASYWSATAPPSPLDRVTLSDTVRNSAFYNRRNVPQVHNRGDAGSAYRLNDTVAAISGKEGQDPLSIKLSLGDSRSLDNQSNFFTTLKSRLQSLGAHLAALSTPDAYAPREVKSSTPTVVTGSAGVDASVATHTVTVERLAVEAQIGSDQQADGYDPLGLSGSFTLNGVTVAVTATDSLNDIADKINYGEDTNKNGRLDKYNEDLNGNGILDVYQSGGVWTGGGYASSFTYYEDINANGVIDGGEDTNNNGALDGGTAESGAVASVVNGRLIITSMRGGDQPITLTENGSVMTSLGFFRVDDNNQKILKTSDENSYNRAGQSASVVIDGERRASPYNTIADALPGLTLQLKQSSTTAVSLSVTEDTAGPVGKIERFAGAYNDMIRLITEQTLNHTPAQNDVRTQDLALQTAIDTHRKVASIGQRPSSLSDIGLTPGGTMPVGIDPATLEALAKKQSSGEGAPPLASGSPGLLSSLNRMGITSEKDMTLTIDRERLSASLKDNPQGIYQLFNTQPDGIRARLQQTIDKATGEPNGIIAYKQASLDHYRSNPNEAQQMMARHELSNRISIERRYAGGVFGALSGGAGYAPPPTSTYTPATTTVVA